MKQPDLFHGWDPRGNKTTGLTVPQGALSVVWTGKDRVSQCQDAFCVLGLPQVGVPVSPSCLVPILAPHNTWL